MKLPNTLKFTGKDTSITGSKKQQLMEALKNRLEIKNKFEKINFDYHGNIPNVFIGSYGYPGVRAGFLGTDDYKNNDSPSDWVKSNKGILDIIRLRAGLLNSNTETVVKTSRQIDSLQEISLSTNSAEAEVNLLQKPVFSMSVSNERLPHGPSAKLKKISVTSNIKVPRIVDRVVSDTDFKAEGALTDLSKKGVDEHYLTKIFSAGNLGVKTERKLVPTKWSITAVDDMLGKQKAKHVNDKKEGGYKVHFGGYLGNYYLIMQIPGPWRYELFETYVGGGLNNPNQYQSATDFENVYGRKKYASNTVGGYYATRLAVLEYLEKTNITASVIVLRFITDEYWAPLGVWVVREATRASLNSKPVDFDSLESVMRFSTVLCLKKYGLNVNKIFRQSKLLNEITSQKSLKNFL